MAGSYPDVPGYRFAYDIDGSTVVVYPFGGGISSVINATTRGFINKDIIYAGTKDRITAGNSTWYAAVIFPEHRNITGYFLSLQSGGSGTKYLEYSADTTNGQDGSWIKAADPYIALNGSSTDSSPYYRDITPVSITNANAVRVTFHNIAYAFHLYGSIPTTESQDRLRILDINDIDISAQLDFGNMKQRASATKQIKVVNNSSTQTAVDITVSVNTSADTTPSLIGQYQISTDNVAFANAVNIGNLAPGTSSETLFLRNNVADNAQLGPWTVRLIAHPVEWS